MAVEINDTYGKYVGNNVNPKIIKRGKNSGIKRDTEIGDRAGESALEKNACDEREVEKVKALLSEAKQKMSSLPDREPTPEEQAIMMMNTLM